MTEPGHAGSDPAETAALYRLIASVLTVPVESVQPDVDLVYDLGAESIDFLDLLFRLEELADERVPPEAWSAWLRQRLPDIRTGRGITPAIVAEFVAYQRAGPATARSAAGAA
jgi:acyl carrier protein